MVLVETSRISPLELTLFSNEGIVLLNILTKCFFFHLFQYFDKMFFFSPFPIFWRYGFFHLFKYFDNMVFFTSYNILKIFFFHLFWFSFFLHLFQYQCGFFFLLFLYIDNMVFFFIFSNILTIFFSYTFTNILTIWVFSNCGIQVLEIFFPDQKYFGRSVNPRGSQSLVWITFNVKSFLNLVFRFIYHFSDLFNTQRNFIWRTNQSKWKV